MGIPLLRLGTLLRLAMSYHAIDTDVRQTRAKNCDASVSARKLFGSETRIYCAFNGMIVVKVPEEMSVDEYGWKVEFVN